MTATPDEPTLAPARPLVETAPPPAPSAWSGKGLARRAPGLALAVGIAVVATIIGRMIPIVGGPVSGIVLGTAVAAVRKPGARFAPGIKTSSKFVLQLAVVILGTQLSLAQIAQVGLHSLPVMLGTLVVCLLAAYLIGRALGIAEKLRTLIGVGTAICGASAIAAATPVIGAAGIEVAYAISTIFLFNVSAVILFPILGHLLGLSQHAFGLFAGTAVNDMSSVVAAATTYGPEAANYAVVVKLVRTLMIIPICLGLAAIVGRKASRSVGAAKTAGAAETDGARPRVRVHRLVPWFLIGFLVLACVNSLGVIPVGSHHALSVVSVFLITVALTAIGLSTDLAGFRRAGLKPVVLGACLWVVVGLTSLGLQALTGVL